MRITKEMKETVIRFDEKNPTAEITTRGAALKRRLGDYARVFPELCGLYAHWSTTMISAHRRS